MPTRDIVAEDAVPPTTRGAATRARIVEAAADLVFADGFANTGLDAVRAASGTSKSQLYHYFADRDDLFRAVVELQTDRVLAAQQPYLDELDSWDSFRRWADAIVGLQRSIGGSGGCPLGSLAVELADDPRARAVAAAGFQRWACYLARGFQRMLDRGDLRADADPDELATAVLAALQGGLLFTDLQRSTGPLELALDMALAHVRSAQS